MGMSMFSLQLSNSSYLRQVIEGTLVQQTEKDPIVESEKERLKVAGELGKRLSDVDSQYRRPVGKIIARTCWLIDYFSREGRSRRIHLC